MKRAHILLLAVLVGSSAFAALLGGPAIGVEASALSSGASGLLAARLYLEARGTPTRLLDQNPAELTGETPSGNRLGRGEVLVVSFPWQRVLPGQRTRLDAPVAAGGTLLVAYTGKLLSVAETPLLESLGLSWHEMKVRLPLHPLRWRQQAGEEWSLDPDPGLGGLLPVRVSALERVPRAPPSARVFFRRGDLPVIFSYAWGRGEVIVVPAQVLANGRLAADGNADLLETLRVRLAPKPWVFDEYHHGLSAATSPEALRLGRVFDLYLAHLAVVYLLGVSCLARRFGPAWIEAPVLTGSVAAFLVGLGALHHRLGHHRRAAELLVSRARELDPRLQVALGPAATDARSLVRVARDVAQAQAKKGE